MISPDELAAGMLPPAASEAPPADVHRVAEAGIALAEQLQAVVPAGRHLNAAQCHLVRALQVAYAGMEPPLVPQGTEDAPVPNTVVDQPAAAAAPADALDVGDVSVWRLGIQTSTSLHPLTRLVALALAEYARPSGHIPAFAQPTLTQLSARTGLPLRALHAHLHDLTTAGWIDRHRVVPGRRRATATHYELRLPNPR